MFHLRRTGCDGSCAKQGYCENLRFYHVPVNFERNAGNDTFIACFNPAKEMSRKGTRICSQTKEAICNVYGFFETQAKKSKCSVAPLKRTAEATKVCPDSEAGFALHSYTHGSYAITQTTSCCTILHPLLLSTV